MPDTGYPTLVVFCKRPALNQGKQRLAREIGAEKALALAELFLRCALEDAVNWPGRVVISPSAREDEAWGWELLPEAVSVIPQPEGNLGVRLQTVDTVLRKGGHSEIVYIGTDAPILSAKHYHTIKAGLAGYDVVLGRALDGGVTFMGSCNEWPDLSPLPWSTEQLAQALIKACQVKGFRVDVCTGAYDVDTQADLTRLYRDLQDEKRPARIMLWRWLHQFYNFPPR